MRKLAPLSREHAAYIAGVIDGEGTVTLTRKHKNEHRQLCVSISSTEKDILNFAVDQELMKRLDDFRFENRIETKSEAIRMLVEKGLND